jgi:hypothetical protein
LGVISIWSSFPASANVLSETFGPTAAEVPNAPGAPGVCGVCGVCVAPAAFVEMAAATIPIEPFARNSLRDSPIDFSHSFSGNRYIIASPRNLKFPGGLKTTLMPCPLQADKWFEKGGYFC